MTERLTAHGVAACENELRAQLSLVKAHSMKAVVDLSAVDQYTLQAREALVAMQTFLGTKATMTAYVGESAGQRGLCLWVSHMVGKQHVRCFTSPAHAFDWLDGDNKPITGVRPLARARQELEADEEAVG